MNGKKGSQPTDIATQYGCNGQHCKRKFVDVGAGGQSCSQKRVCHDTILEVSPSGSGYNEDSPRVFPKVHGIPDAIAQPLLIISSVGQTRCATTSFTPSMPPTMRSVDAYVGGGPTLLDFGSGLIMRHETSDDVDALECDVDKVNELQVHQLCEAGTDGIRKTPHTDMPQGERPSYRTRKQHCHMGLSTTVPTDPPSTSSQPECQTSMPTFVSTAFSADRVVPDARRRFDTTLRIVGPTPISNPYTTPPEIQRTPTPNTQCSRSGYTHIGRCALLDFGAGLMRHEAAIHSDVFECDMNVVGSLGAREFCNEGNPVLKCHRTDPQVSQYNL